MVQLSVVIPHYNSPELLKRLLDSIPDIPEIEILVIDDNSDREKKSYDECMSIYQKRNVAFYKNSVTMKGAGNARNIGIERARGKWIIFADADDFFVEDFWNTIQEQLEDPAEIIFFPPISMNQENGKAADRHIYYAELVRGYIQNSDHENELKLRYSFWAPWSKMFRRELVERELIRFDGTLYSNDIMFSAKAGRYAKAIKAVNKVIYCITQSKDSLTAKKDAKSLEIRKNVFCNYYFYLHGNLKKEDMRILGYKLKDYFYFLAYRLKLLQLKEGLKNVFSKSIENN